MKRASAAEARFEWTVMPLMPARRCIRRLQGGCVGLVLLGTLIGCHRQLRPDEGANGLAMESAGGAGVTSTAGTLSKDPANSNDRQAGAEPTDAGTTVVPPISGTVSSGASVGEAGAAFESAVATIKEGPASYREALKHLDNALSMDPRFAEAHFNEGVLYQQLGEEAKAEKEYRRALEIRPQFVEAWANLASLYVQQKDYVRALDTIAEGLKYGQDNALLLNNRAMAYREMGRTTEAIEEVRRILKLNAIDVNAFNNLGRIYLGMKDYEMARLVFQKALITAPAAKDDPYIHHNLGVAYLGLKDSRAQEEFDRALSLNGELVESLIGRAYLHLELQEYDGAAELLRRAVAVAPKNVTARLNLGVALRGMSELDRAEQQYVEALKIEPRNTSVLLNYGILLGDYKRDYVRAAEMYKRLKEAATVGADVENADKLMREAQLNHEREEKRRERERLREEERAKKQAADAAARDEQQAAPPGGSPVDAGGHTEGASGQGTGYGGSGGEAQNAEHGSESAPASAGGGVSPPSQ